MSLSSNDLESKGEKKPDFSGCLMLLKNWLKISRRP
jgi:hypothetical protein